MGVYVAEIGGRGIVAIGDVSQDEAESWVGSEDLRSDLMTLDHEDGPPLWDGKTEIFLRIAFPEERERWAASQQLAMRSGSLDDDEEDDSWVVYLVPVVDPTDNE